MRRVKSIVAAVPLFLLAVCPAFAQVNSTPTAPEQGAFVALRGNTRPEANATNDGGRVADDLTFHHMMLQLRRTPAQEQALQQLIKDLHDPTSPLFHHWITAAEFGQRYGVSSADIAKVTDWLESQGFTVNLVYPNQMVIDFTGSAGRIRQAFHTEVHNLLVKGQAHIANMSDPQIPAAVASTVAGVVSLNDFRPQPMLKPRSSFTAANGTYPVVPADLATIYNFNPAFAAGFSGQGQTVVVIEDTDLYSTADWDAFRSVLGLASAYPQGSLVQVNPPSSPTNNCNDPGVNGDDDEAAVDVEWASAGAPSATIELASCQDYLGTFGGFIALQNLLNASGTPPAIVSISYGESESLLGASFNAYISFLYQQAVAEGVSVFVSSGDQGAASSDVEGPYAQGGINISGFTSTPYNVSVGGTDFADTYERNNPAYWKSANAANYGSALSYIPEIPWNDSCASVLFSDFNRTWPTYGSGALCNSSDLTIVAGSGGPSGCATGTPDTYGIVGGTCGGYAKPWWQSGLIGNPSDGVRDIPDVSLFASNGFWAHAYGVCFSDPNNGGVSCSGTPDTWSRYGGTSFSAPIMAAIQSLVNQASGSRWGNPNPAYYSLAATEYGSIGSTSCNSALGNHVASNCIFHDVTQIPLLYGGTGTGGDIDVPCRGVNCYLPSGSYGVLSTAPQTLNYADVSYLGSGYTSPPSCTLSGGGGSGASCSAGLTGQVSSLTLTNGGSGYVPADTTCALTGGGGTGATCALGATDTGEIALLILTNRGSGYTSAPTCTISGEGTGATCTATEQLGAVVSITSGGSGYTTMPHCVLSGGGGTGATCAALALNNSDDYQPAFGAGTGWDFATGIGTVNVSNLVSNFVSNLATLTLSPPSLAFPPQVPNISSATQSVVVTALGTANLFISTVTIGGTNASDFARSVDTCTGATVIPNGTCTVSVTFTPTAMGNRAASLSFTGSAFGSPQTMTLTGVGANPLPFINEPLVPASVALGRPAFTLTVKGTNFLPGATVDWNGVALATTFVSNEELAATVPAAIIALPGTASISAVNPGFALTSNVVFFSVTPLTSMATFTKANGSPIVAGTNPRSVAVGDFNGDGKLDLAVANAGSNNLTILLGNGDGTFTPAASSPATGAFPFAVAVGDFNGDGKLDLAVANAESNDMTILLGNGDGTFMPAASSLYTGLSPYSIAMGDFNGDGKLDLAVANEGDNNVTILLGNRDGTFAAAASSPSTGIGPDSVAVGDFNGDGKLDLAVANLYSNSVTILLGKGDGTFTPNASSPAAGAFPSAVAVGDFNGDGKLDLAVANAESNNLTILLGNGDGTFTAVASSPSTGIGPTSVAVGDFNGDGKLDLAVVNACTDNVTILLGNGDGTFTPNASSPATGASPTAVAVGDFNGDGRLDLATANYSSNNVSVMLLLPPAPVAGVSTSSLTFSAQLVGTNGTAQSVTLTNTGNASLTFTAIGVTGPFAIAASGTTCSTSNPVAASGTCTVAITFAPTAPGTASGSVSFANNATTSPQMVALSGTGVGPFVSLSATTLTFPSQLVGSTSTVQMLTLNNTGTAVLTIASIAASGDFSQTNTCGGSVAAGGSCTFNVAFMPTANGTRTGALTITDNHNAVAGSTQRVTLTGTGIEIVVKWPGPIVLPLQPPPHIVPGQPKR